MKYCCFLGPALALLAALPLASQAQTTTGGVRIGTAGAPATSAVLDLSPDAANAPKGLLPPRLTQAQRNAIGSPIAGLVVYQTDIAPGLYVYTGTAWMLQGDNLGNHTATQNLNLGNNTLVGGGGSQGLSINNKGRLTTDSNLIVSSEVALDATQSSNGTLNGGLRLGGMLSGEGLASKRNGGGNQYGLDFYTSSLNRLSISGTGNVGIGTTTPGQLLDVNGNQNLTGSLTLNTGDQDKIYLTSQGAAGSKLGHGAGWGLLSYAGPGTGSQGYHAWLLSGATAYQEGMRLTATGLGIGTTTPGQQVELGGQGTPTLLLHSTATNVLSGATLQFRENDPTYGWNLRHNSGQAEGSFEPLNVANTHDRLLLEGVQGATPTTLMTWDQTGHRVGINTNSPSTELQVNGTIFATVEVVASNFRTNSDARLKQQMRPIGGALADVQRLRGVRYTWNAQGIAHGGQAGAEQLGLLAQELEQVYPELVSTGPHGYKTVNYAQLTPVLLEAIKELAAQNAALKAQVAGQQANLGSFEQRLRALETGSGQAHN